MRSTVNHEADAHILILVQNLSVPLDRRVWQECTSLRRAGFRVSVICPRAPEDAGFEEIDGVRIHRYEPPVTSEGSLGYVHEFSMSWLATARLAVRIYRQDRFQVIQACNPPDTLWLIALAFRPLGVRFVYDQHDLCPEVFAVRFPGRRRLLAGGLRLLERLSYATAAVVIAPNESYKRVAVTRGHREPRSVQVVRSGPDPEVMRPGPADPALAVDGRHLCCYLGIMGPQDGVDLLLRAVDVIVHERGRTDVHVALLGFGDCLDDLKALATELDLDPWVTFTGRADRDAVRRYLSSAEVGLCPDPRNPFNDVSTMNKTLEYMAFGLPVVSFDLHETRESAGDAAVYVADQDLGGFADAVIDLLDDPERGAAMGRIGRQRIEGGLGWPHQSPRYVEVYNQLLGNGQPTSAGQVIDLTSARTTVEVGR